MLQYYQLHHPLVHLAPLQYLNSQSYAADMNDGIDLNDPVEITIEKYENHPSIITIKEILTLQGELNSHFGILT